MQRAVRLSELVASMAAPARRVEEPKLAPHQIVAADAILALIDRFGGATLADEAGLGKSWVAAAVAAHLAAQGVQPELIAPASLVAQWTALLPHFGLDGVPVLSHDSLHSREIMPGAKAPKLLVVDEAHRFRNPSTRRYAALARRTIGNRLLLVTATPICNSRFDLLALLQLILADDALKGDGVLSIEGAFRRNDPGAIRRIVAAVVVRRGEEVLAPQLKFGALTRRVVRHETFDGGGEVPRLFASMQFPLIARGGERRILRMFLWRRLESSEAACIDSLKRQRRFYRRARESMLDGCRLTKDDYRRLFGDADDDAPFQDLLFKDLWMPRDGSGDVQAIDAETVLIDRALTILGGGSGAKIAQLEANVDAATTIVFTGSIATARAIHDRLRLRLRSALVTSRFCRIGERVSDRDAVLEAFARGRVDALISTDLAAEGLNLQAASRVVHFDLPWNPVKLDQRNGRAFRIGQTSPQVEAVYFIPARRSDRAGLLPVIAGKNRRRRAILDGHRPSCASNATEGDEAPVACGANAHERLWVVSANRLPRIMIERDGIVTDDVFVIEEFLEQHRTCRAVAVVVDSDDAQAKRAHDDRVNSRLALPSVLAASSAQSRLERQLRRRACLTPQLAELLARRYPAGVEALLGEVAAEFLDRSRASFVESVLARQIGLAAGDGPTRILAAILIGPDV